MIKKEEILKILEDYPGREEIFVVDLRISSSNRISLFVDRMEGIPIEECVKLSRFIEHHLDRDKEDFELMVSSPGLDMPFLVKEQYRKYTGKQIKLKLKDGRERKGQLVEVSEDGIVFEEKRKTDKKKNRKKKKVEEEPVRKAYSFDEIEQAKLIIEFK